MSEKQGQDPDWMNDDAEPVPTIAGSPAVHGKPPTKGARWGEPIVFFDRAWTRFEIAFAVLALTLEISSMSLWFILKGFSTAPDSPAAVAFRGMLGATVLGTAAHLALSKQNLNVRRGVTVGAVFLGLLLAKAWTNFGVESASNIINWYQQACILTLFGGLRGLGTRLTMLLALLGGSMATSRGRHIVIDVVTRFVSHKTRVVMALVSWLGAAVVCLATGWGFFDHISIENFGARADDSAGQKVGQVFSHIGEDFFIARKQLALDLKATPHVLFRGEVYSDWLGGKEWNDWVDNAGFVERYGKEATDTLHIPEDETRAPLVVIPGRGEPRGELINAAHLVFPIGLFVIAMRFIIRGLLVLSGHASVESDESEDFGEQAHIDEEEASAPAK
jgi:TRAP-type C4-dicarboxylate transport system permease small subunit